MCVPRTQLDNGDENAISNTTVPKHEFYWQNVFLEPMIFVYQEDHNNCQHSKQENRWHMYQVDENYQKLKLKI